MALPYQILITLTIKALLLFRNPVLGMYFTTSGYEHCVCNLAINDQIRDLTSRNVVEDLVFGTTAGIQRWTIFHVDQADVHRKRFLDRVQYFKESCSVNILVAIERCFERNLNNIFGHRLFNRQNTVIMLIGIKTMCTNYQQTGNVLHGTDTQLETVSIFLTGRKAAYAVFSCVFCSKSFHALRIPSNVDLHSIEEIRDFSDFVVRKSMLPVLGIVGVDIDLPNAVGHWEFVNQCKFLYRTRKVTPASHLGCDGRLITMENVAYVMNVSLMLSNQVKNFAERFISSPRKHYSALVALRLYDITRPNLKLNFPLSFISPFILEMELSKFIYCVKRDEREGFNILFWKIPLDSWSWLGLSISSLALTLQLRGQWFQIYSILMRQSCTVLNRHRTLIIFIFATIIFTYGYEGIVSSFVIVPPPIIVLENLKDLLTHRYQIIGNRNHPVLQKVFMEENITQFFNTSFVPPGDSLRGFEILEYASNCNATFIGPTNSLDRLMLAFPDVQWHAASDTVIPVESAYHLFGTFHYKFGLILLRMREAGLLQWIDSTATSLFNNVAKMLSREDRKEPILTNLPVAFQLSDWRILSMFAVWASLLVISAVALLLEVIVRPSLLYMSSIVVQGLSFFRKQWDLRKHQLRIALELMLANFNDHRGSKDQPTRDH